NKIFDLRRRSSIIIVSHNMAQISRMCDRAIVLFSAGEMINYKDVSTGIRDYLNIFKFDKSQIISNKGYMIQDLRVNSSMMNGHNVVNYKNDLEIEFVLKGACLTSGLELVITIQTQSSQVVAGSSTKTQDIKIKDENPISSVTVSFKKLLLSPGMYNISVTVRDYDSAEILAWNFCAISFEVLGSFYSGAPVQLFGDWQINKKKVGVC
ncbi:MAG: Wzt carbohydrate-binding domain-containing protein, partial [Candidatus Aminicenantes bacterium]|nr:Wzt carbohydrate-binding domain-containing protein [Candidatus Aminicenantes bacterium]